MHSKFLFIFILLFVSPILLGQEGMRTLKLCYGQMMGNNWDKANRQFIRDIFSDAELLYELEVVPTARGERMFEVGECDIHTGVSEMPWTKKYQSILVQESLYRVELVIYESIAPTGLVVNKDTSLLDFDQDGYTIGFMRSDNMIKLFKGFKSAHLVDLLDIKQGVAMLKTNRLQFLVIPEIKTTFPDDFASEKKGLNKIYSALSTNLHWWLAKEHTVLEGALSSAIKRTKEKYQLEVYK